MPTAPPLPQPYRIQGGVNVQVPIFPPDYIPYIQTMGYDPWYGGNTLAGTQHQDMMGLNRDTLDLQRDQFDWNRVLNMAEMTGQYEGQDTLFAQQQRHQQGLDLAGLTGFHNGTPTFQRYTFDQGHLNDMALAGLQGQTQRDVANIGAGAQRDVANIAAEVQRYAADLDHRARMFEAEGTRLYQQGLLEIQRGQLDLGYAQLAESRRQFDRAHALDQERFQLEEQQFAHQRETDTYQMAANPRNWVAMSYAAHQRTPPPSAAAHSTPHSGELV